MAIFAIADLHLSHSTDKPMDVFGSRWTDYQAKIEKNWRLVVTDNDTVIIPGDISWAMHLEDAYEDLLFLEKLPGKKLLGKGNHDYWWETMKKNQAFLQKCGFQTIDFLYNNAFEVGNLIACGTRGWYLDEKLQNAQNSPDYDLVVAREVGRLKMSLEEGKKLKEQTGKEIVVFLHFPPIFNDFICKEIIDTLKEYQIKRVFFGHIHGSYNVKKTFSYENIDFTLISADFLSFIPNIITTF